MNRNVMECKNNENIGITALEFVLPDMNKNKDIIRIFNSLHI